MEDVIIEKPLGLTTMPVEIETMIIKNVHPSDALNLQLANHYYYNAASLKRLDRIQVQDFLHERELRSSNSSWFACNMCHTLKPVPAFPVGQIKRHGKHSFDRWRERFCLTCGLESGKVTPGSKIKVFRGQSQVLCTACSTLRDRYCDVCCWCYECAKKGSVRTVRWGAWAEKCGVVGEVVLENKCKQHLWRSANLPL